MPRLDRFVDPLQHGIDYMKHRVEDMYDAAPAQKPGFFANLFRTSEPSYAQQLGQMGARKFGKVAQRFGSGYGQQHYGRHGHEQQRGIFGYGEEPSWFQSTLNSIENSIFDSTIGPSLSYFESMPRVPSLNATFVIAPL